MTFKSVPLDDDAAMEDWHIFSSRLCWHYPELQGVRVTELHRSHGIHFHFFVNIRVPIDHMRKIVFLYRPNCNYVKRVGNVRSKTWMGLGSPIHREQGV